MWRSKKFIIVAVLTAVILAGSIGGVVLAQTENEADNQTEARCGVLLDRVCEIYEENTGTAIDAQELQKAFTEARNELMAEARENFRQRLIDEGKITQEQLDEFDAWLEARPDIPFPFGPGDPYGIKPFGGEHHGFGRFGGGFPGWGGPCPHAE
jgi:uncharacterized membrane protein